jgi:hypothetical protein
MVIEPYKGKLCIQIDLEMGSFDAAQRRYREAVKASYKYFDTYSIPDKIVMDNENNEDFLFVYKHRDHKEALRLITEYVENYPYKIKSISYIVNENE